MRPYSETRLPEGAWVKRVQIEVRLPNGTDVLLETRTDVILTEALVWRIQEEDLEFTLDDHKIPRAPELDFHLSLEGRLIRREGQALASVTTTGPKEQV